jgi:hypothetical protein
MRIELSETGIYEWQTDSNSLRSAQARNLARIFVLFPLFFMQESKHLFKPPKELRTNHEKICNGSSAHVCAIDFDICGQHADYWNS